MSYRICCVSGCTVTYGQGVALHNFPNPDKDIDRFQAWLKVVGNELANLDNSYIFKNRRVCHRHFEPIYHYTKCRLNRLSIPTLHMPGSISDSQKQHVALDESTEEVTEHVPSPRFSEVFEEIGLMPETIDLEDFTQSLDNFCKEFTRLNKLFSDNPTPYNLKAMQTLTSFMRNISELSQNTEIDLV